MKKKVLPAACPGASYEALDGVRDGGMAQEAFLEALAPDISISRKAELERQLAAYCRLDTHATYIPHISNVISRQFPPPRSGGRRLLGGREVFLG